MSKKKISRKELERLQKIKNNAFSSGWSGRGLSALDKIETFEQNYKSKKKK